MNLRPSHPAPRAHRNQHYRRNRGIKAPISLCNLNNSGHCLSEDGCYGHTLKLETQEITTKGLGLFSGEGGSQGNSQQNAKLITPRSQTFHPQMTAFLKEVNNPSHSGGSDGKESASAAGDLGSILGSGRSGEGNGYPLQFSFLENYMERSLAGYSPGDHKESEITESEITWTHSTSCILPGNSMEKEVGPKKLPQRLDSLEQRVGRIERAGRDRKADGR